MAFVLSVFLVLSVIAVSYDGGLVCFLAPRRCSYNQIEEQVAPLPPTPTKDRQGYESATATLGPTPTQWLTPTSELTLTPDASQSLPVALERTERGEVDCGPNPYRYNDVSERWERRFHEVCYGVTFDPFEAIFGGWNERDGLDYEDVTFVLGLLDANRLTKEQQLAVLVEEGLWSPECECSRGDLNAVIARLVYEPPPTPTVTPIPFATETDK